MNRTINNRKQRVIVGMSGGVDSSAAALLLLQAGYDVIGATMDTGYGKPVEQAAHICRGLNIPHYVVDMREEFECKIIRSFVSSYERGETPNPCILCNGCMKFSAFLPLMAELNAEYMATGHYIRKEEYNGRAVLRCGIDASKDQSYFLYQVPQKILQRCLFPLGELRKDEVRAIAEKAGLASARQKDSFDVCFAPEGEYRSVLEQFSQVPALPGDIVDVDGKVVGKHQGLANYTVGQRRGLDVALGYPVYVLELDSAANRLVVGEKSYLKAEIAYTVNNHFLPFPELCEPMAVDVRVRHKARPVKALIQPEDADGKLIKISFLEPEWGIAPGQSAVFYQGDMLIGGGQLIKHK